MEPFALCDIRQGSRLSLEPPQSVIVHFILEGGGMLELAKAEPIPLEVHTLVLIPRGVGHSVRARDGQVVVHADEATLPSAMPMHRSSPARGIEAWSWPVAGCG